MSTTTVKLVMFLALFVHGIGHLQGVVSSSGVKFRTSTSNASWLLKGLGVKWNKVICLVLYLAASVLGIFAALSFRGVLGPESQWTSLAMACAVFSSLGLILFPKALALFFNKTGAIAVNLFIFYSILFNGNLPSAIFED
jgi:predicted permease